jgi:hypothetical protein
MFKCASMYVGTNIQRCHLGWQRMHDIVVPFYSFFVPEYWHCRMYIHVMEMSGSKACHVEEVVGGRLVFVGQLLLSLTTWAKHWHIWVDFRLNSTHWAVNDRQGSCLHMYKGKRQLGCQITQERLKRTDNSFYDKTNLLSDLPKTHYTLCENSNLSRQNESTL